MKLSEAKLRQIVREELVRDYKRKLKEAGVVGQHRRAAAVAGGGTGEQGSDSGTPFQVARGIRKQKKDIIDDLNRQLRDGEIDKPTRDRLVAMAKDKSKLQIDQYRAEFQAAVLQSKEAAKLVIARNAEAEIEQLVADGVPQDSATDAVHGAALAVLDADVATSGDQAAASVDIPTSVLRSGKSGADVTTLQNWLEPAGYPVDVDGKFGGKTKVAVIQFQKQEGLKQDGVVGEKTWTALARKQSGGGEVEEETEETETVNELTRKSFRKLISRELRRL
jgi:hypothetical protein